MSKTELRIKKVDTRFTEEEYKLILELERTLGISKTELVRSRVLNDAGRITINAKELIAALDGVGAELGRSGNNINQLAKHANIMRKRGRLDPAVIEQFNLLFGVYLENQKALERVLRKIARQMIH